VRCTEITVVDLEIGIGGRKDDMEDEESRADRRKRAAALRARQLLEAGTVTP
jgi:hypothetical protein